MCGWFSEEEVNLDPTWMVHVVTRRWKERCGAVSAVFEEIVSMCCRGYRAGEKE